MYSKEYDLKTNKLIKTIKKTPKECIPIWNVSISLRYICWKYGGIHTTNWSLPKDLLETFLRIIISWWNLRCIWSHMIVILQNAPREHVVDKPCRSIFILAFQYSQKMSATFGVYLKREKFYSFLFIRTLLYFIGEKQTSGVRIIE